MGLWPWPWIFISQIFKKSYQRNSKADWHGMKRMWIDRKWDTLCGFELIWAWPWIFKVKFWKRCISRKWGSITMEQKWCEPIQCCHHVGTTMWPRVMTLTLEFIGQILNKAISATGLVILFKLDSNRWFFILCDLEIWWMTLQNNRAPLLYYFKLCASFQIHWWIQTWVTVWKPLIRVKIGDFLSCVALKFDGGPWKTIGHLFNTISSFVHHFKSIGEFKLELQSGNTHFGSKLALFDNFIKMGQMAFLLRRWQPHVRRDLLLIIMLPDGGFLLTFHLCAFFSFDSLGDCSLWGNQW